MSHSVNLSDASFDYFLPGIAYALPRTADLAVDLVLGNTPQASLTNRVSGGVAPAAVGALTYAKDSISLTGSAPGIDLGIAAPKEFTLLVVGSFTGQVVLLTDYNNQSALTGILSNSSDSTLRAYSRLSNSADRNCLFATTGAQAVRTMTVRSTGDSSYEVELRAATADGVTRTVVQYSTARVISTAKLGIGARGQGTAFAGSIVARRAAVWTAPLTAAELTTLESTLV